ncbi:hypothetical protein GCM10010123_20080 [Pilimelia anulata]|uniref:Uncharacterized protein n=1 Tax=Pilimelia anulata TaxID=53371 RepID=A0A8J3B226_9ACTN|nr:hypothetical protein [Pilimelia anulata]GGJ90277.1 hypothetical protein GCM10010123_20080 [Pilimelia anulata]
MSSTYPPVTAYETTAAASLSIGHRTYSGTVAPDRPFPTGKPAATADRQVSAAK